VLLFVASNALAAKLDVPYRLCTDAQCPEAVDIPDNYGIQLTCGTDADLTAGADVWEEKWAGFPLMRVNTGKRFKSGIFNIEKVEQTSTYDWTDAGTNGWNYFRLGRVTYTVKCQNGITYRDVFEWSQKDQYDIYRKYDEDAVDHFCESTLWHNCSDGSFHNGVFREVSPVSYDPNTRVIAPLDPYSKDLKLPIGTIVNQWVGRKVGLPKYYGGVNRLAVPIVLVNGLGFDFRSMGAIPKEGKGTDAWRKGYVSDYAQGSLPDILSRAYGLEKGASAINQNGIYFLNLDMTAQLESTQERDQLLTRLAEMILVHTSGELPTLDLKVDVVCHSSGCLLLREAIAKANEYAPVKGFHPVNHIRKIITINAPHDGTGLGRSLQEMGGFNDYRGLPEMLSQLENPNPNQAIISGSIYLDFSSMAYEGCTGWTTPFCWVAGTAADMALVMSELRLDKDFDHVPFNLTGSMFGEKKLELNGIIQKMIPAQVGFREQMLEARKAAIQANQWITSRRNQDYPRYPNGKYIDLQAFYSDRADALEVGLAREISDGVLSNVCESGSDACNTLKDYLTNTARSTIDAAVLGQNGGALLGNDDVKLSVNPDYTRLMSEMRAGWLNASDMVVERRSQVWNLTSVKLDASNNVIPELHLAKTYQLHNAEVPEGHPSRPVLHGPLFSLTGSATPPAYLSALNEGATSMGRDLYCALEPGCQRLLAADRPILYGGPAVMRQVPSLPDLGNALEQRAQPTQALDLQGDFDLYAQILSQDHPGIAIQNDQGKIVAAVGYSAQRGTWSWTDGPNGGAVRILLAPDHRPQFGVQRSGAQVSARLQTQTGQVTIAALGSVSSQKLTVLATGDGLDKSKVLFLGTATPTTVLAQTPPPKWGEVRALVQERGQHEPNQCRPWLWAANTTDRSLGGLQLRYYFTADPARKPVVEIDYPQDLSWTFLHRGGNLWEVQISLPSLPANTSTPAGGIQMRIHYQDWGPWSKTDDPSLGSAVVAASERVVVADALGRIVWGAPPASPYLGTVGVPVAPAPGLVASWKDGGVSEANMIRPQISLRNTGTTTSLEKGYEAILTVKGAVPFAQAPVLEGWYHPACQGRVELAADGSLKFHWTFTSSLEPGQSIDLGQWGIHWPDWRSWTKSGLVYQVEIRSAAGVVHLADSQVTR